MRGLKLFLVMMAGVTLLGCQVKRDGASTDKLAATEIEALFENRTVESFNLVNGNTSFTYYGADGSVYQERYWEARTGQWKINDKAEMCMSMEGKPFSCRSIYLSSGKYYKYRMNNDGEREKIIRYRQFIEGKVF